MKKAFFSSLVNEAETNKDIYLLIGDVGYSVAEEFQNRFPSRFINTGIAEQNMMGVAAGLALEGKIPFVYSLANFPVFRCMEQIRNDVSYHNLNVKIVSNGAGFTYNTAGYSHHCLEDIGVMKLMPNFTIICPADPTETTLAVKGLSNLNTPCYLRLGKGETLYNVIPDYQIGKAIEIEQGDACSIVCTGSTLKIGKKVHNYFLSSGVNCQLLSMHTIHPFDFKSIKCNRVLTIEDHGPGGLADSVKLYCNGIQLESLMLHPLYISGSMEELMSLCRVDVKNSIEKIKQLCNLV